MEQGRFSLTPRTQRRSQNFHSDAAKIGIFLITSKFSSSECIENYIFFAESRENSTNSQTLSLFFRFSAKGVSYMSLLRSQIATAIIKI